MWDWTRSVCMSVCCVQFANSDFFCSKHVSWIVIAYPFIYSCILCLKANKVDLWWTKLLLDFFSYLHYWFIWFLNFYQLINSDTVILMGLSDWHWILFWDYFMSLCVRTWLLGIFELLTPFLVNWFLINLENMKLKNLVRSVNISFSV